MSGQVLQRPAGAPDPLQRTAKQRSFQRSSNAQMCQKVSFYVYDHGTEIMVEERMQDSGKSRGRRGYAADFKQRALSRLESGEASLRQVAKEFEVSVPTLIKWRKEEHLAGRPHAAVAQPPRRERETTATELERLREEVEQLKQERDRLRQGIAILAGLNYKVTP